MFDFDPIVKAGMAAGKYVQVFSNDVPIGMVRDAANGQFVAHATGIINNGTSINPLISSAQFVQGWQANFQGINAVQSSLGVLQATTAAIGIGTAVGVGLSAVNLWQTFKLRQDVRQLNLDVRDGFLDLKSALKDQGREVIQHIDQVAEDIKFSQHRLELIKAYGRFIEATKLIKTAKSLQNTASKNIELANARQTLGEALAIYNNPHLLSETCAAGKLRRLECAWGIEQTIILTYQLQDELKAVGDRLIDLQAKIKQDCLTVIDGCESYAELDFIYPEITYICNHDLVVLEAWQNQVEWMYSLPPSELELLAISPNSEAEIIEDHTSLTTVKLAEISWYEAAKEKSHSASLIDQLKLKLSPTLQHQYQQYIFDTAMKLGHQTIANNLNIASNLTLANLYWYFQNLESNCS